MSRAVVNERRAHKRFRVTCPVVVTGGDGRELLRGRTLNLSDGGVLLAGGDAAMPVGQTVQAAFRVPRQTANTFLYEDVSSPARVVRHEGATKGSGSAVAFQFSRPLQLELEP
jgi:c-di-GMP-binding flagellar brake protein YcgR